MFDFDPIEAKVVDTKKELRMYLIVREDLDFTTHVAKFGVQCGHAFATALLKANKKNPELVENYYDDDQPKIVLKCKNLDALQRANNECMAADLNTFFVIDAGRTVFNEPTPTCMAIGPCYREDLPKYVQKLQLF